MKKSDILEHYRKRRDKIESRLQEFREFRDADEKRKFLELTFVILTSRTDAEKSWEAALELEEKGKLLAGEPDEVRSILEEKGVQYADDKSKYIAENREMLSQPTLSNPEKRLKISSRIDPEDLESSRRWLAENVSGIGWKGASHFLRNIGYGDNFAIISGHILDAMVQLGLSETSEPPSSRDEYLEKEKRLREFAEDTGIDIKALDLVFWSMKTGQVFK
ncbi:MAG: hypothetical protein ABEJ36_05555 [Candidatus Nanosalina sp.]